MFTSCWGEQLQGPPPPEHSIWSVHQQKGSMRLVARRHALTSMFAYYLQVLCYTFLRCFVHLLLFISMATGRIIKALKQLWNSTVLPKNGNS